jgi:hypothetical protein
VYSHGCFVSFVVFARRKKSHVREGVRLFSSG